jgi:hypothetical protein
MSGPTLLFADLETYFKSGKDGLSLRTSTYPVYCNDPRFHIIGVSLAWGDAEPVWYAGADAHAALLAIDWANTVAVFHNSAFDLSVLHYALGIHPAHQVCTMSLATAAGFRAMRGGSLDAMSKALQELGFNMPNKGTEVIRADGLRLQDFSPQQLHEYGLYCNDDVRICRAIYYALQELIPVDELRWQSMVLGWGTNPQLILDKPLLEAELQRVTELQASTLDVAAARHGCTSLQFKAILMSNPQFCKLLEQYGAEVPMKVSKTTGKEAPALAKTDEGMTDLLEHDDINIRVFAQARLGNKSSGEQTKIARMLELADLGPVPLYMQVSGAHTHRLSSTQGFNPLALSSGRVAGTTNACRRAMMAPPGYLTISCDSAQIELRTAGFICDDRELNWVFKQGADPYSTLAGAMYRRDADEIRAGAKAGDPECVRQRAGGKSGLLGGLYGASAAGFWQYSRSIAKNKISMEEAKDTVDTFRNKFTAIPAFWRKCDVVLQQMIRGGSGFFGGPNDNLFYYDGERTILGMPCPGIMLPSGMWIGYPGLRREKAPIVTDGSYQRDTVMVYDKMLGRTKVPMSIYSSRAFENLNQSLAFAVIKHQMLMFDKRYKTVMNLHDELVALVPIGEEAEALKFAEECFAATPDWLNGCLLKGEAGVAARYGDC